MNEPWLQRNDWREKRVSARITPFSALPIILFGSVFAVPGLYALWRSANGGDVAFGVLFSLVGGFIVLGGVALTMRSLRFGNAVLELDTVPIPIGGKLAGTVRLGRGVGADCDVTVVVEHLRITETTSRAGGAVAESVTVTAKTALDARGPFARVELDMPPHGAPASLSTTIPADVWRMRVSVELPTGGRAGWVIEPLPVFWA